MVKDGQTRSAFFIEPPFEVGDDPVLKKIPASCRDSVADTNGETWFCYTYPRSYYNSDLKGLGTDSCIWDSSCTNPSVKTSAPISDYGKVPASLLDPYPARTRDSILKNVKRFKKEQGNTFPYFQFFRCY